MAGPAIFGGSRTKIITSKGLLLKDGTPIDFNGPKNYITRGTFSTNETTGWSLKRTTLSGLIPNQVAASWTTPTVLTLSATTTGALTNSGYSLSLAASAATTAGDMLVSDAYTIDIEDQAKVLNFKFSYKAYANASNMNFSGTSSNTFHVYIYDVTNNAWIQPAGCYTMVQNSGVGIGYGTFQTPANMTQFRIAIVSCNASAGAFTLYTDNFFVGPQQFNMGPPVTDWVSYTPTITTATGTMTNYVATGLSRRVGDSLEVNFQIRFTGAVGTWTFPFITIPSGLNIDTAKFAGTNDFASMVLGMGGSVRTAVSNQMLGIRYASTTTVGLISQNTASTYEIDSGVGSATPVSWGSGDVIWGNFKVPISGWSSNTVMSSDAATNVVAANINDTVTVTMNPNANSVKVPINSVTIDTNSSWDSVNKRYVIPVSGQYLISSQLNLQGTNVLSGTRFHSQIWVNGSIIIRGTEVYTSTNGQYIGTSVSGVWTLKAGDYVELYMYGSANNSVNLLSTGGTMLSLQRISGPAQIAASSVVAFSASRTAGNQSVSSGGTLSPVIFNSVTTDSHSAYNASTGVYTIPVSGFYEIIYKFTWTGTVASGYISPSLNGISGATMWVAIDSTNPNYRTQQLTSPIGFLTAGTQISCNFYTLNAGTLTLIGDNATTNMFSIKRLGGVM